MPEYAGDEPNYRQIKPPEDKPKHEYSKIERRAEIYDMIERAGHYRNLERSQRELGQMYDKSQSTICYDIQVINDFMAENIGQNAEAELESLRNAAVQSLIDEGKEDQAYRLMKEHYQLLQGMGIKDKEPDELEVDWREYVRQGDDDDD